MLAPAQMTEHHESTQHEIHIGVHPTLHAAGLDFHADTLITLGITSLILIILAVVVRLRINTNPRATPSRFQSMMEMIVETVRAIPEGRMGQHGVQYVPVLGTFFLFITCANWLGAVPLTAIATLFLGRFVHPVPELAPPTSDLNTTVGLALVVFMSTHFYGFKARGIGYFKHFIEPYPFFLPLNLMEELSKPLSLSIRLFGNIFGKEVIILILTSLLAIPLLYPIPLLALSLLIGFIQAFIFTLLATFYIAAAVEGHGGH